MSVEIADMENPDYGVGCKTNSRSSGPPIVCEADLAISTTFFSTFPKPVYVVELNATNSQDAAGEIFVKLGNSFSSRVILRFPNTCWVGKLT